MKTGNDGTECIEKQSAHSIPTSYVESEQTTSARLQKLPTQLNTPNIFIPDLVRVSPNASDVQWLGQCVPAFRLLNLSNQQSIT